MRRLLALTATTAALAATLAVAPAASADTQTSKDPRGDTSVLQPGSPRLAATLAQAVDITGVRTVYQGEKVKVVLTLADLGAFRSADYLQYVARARSGENDFVFGIVKQGPTVQALIAPTTQMRRGLLTRTRAPRGTGECVPGYAVDRRADTVTLTSSRACLGAGSSVRTGAIAAAALDSEFTRFRADDGRRDGQASPQASDVKLGRAVDRN